MAAISTATIVSAAIGLAGVGFQVYSGSKQRSAQKKRQRLLEQKQRADTRRARRQALREARIARGSVVNQGANSGVLGSSGALGAVASINSQAGSNFGYLSQTQNINAGIGAANQSAISAQGFASIGSGLTRLGSMGIRNARTIDNLMAPVPSSAA